MKSRPSRYRAIPAALAEIARASEYKLTGRDLMRALAIARGWRKVEGETCAT